MPPVTTPPAAQNAATDPQTLTDELFVKINKMDENDREVGERQFLRAISLEGQKASIMRQINANRGLLRTLDDTDELTADLSDWLDEFYPTKEKDAKRDADEVKQTRLNHEAAARLGKVSKR
jgi:hypothetical protein